MQETNDRLTILRGMKVSLVDLIDSADRTREYLLAAKLSECLDQVEKVLAGLI